MRVNIVVAYVVAVLAFALSLHARAQAPQAASGASRPTQPASNAAAAEPAPPAAERPRATRPPLFLKEDWKQIPGGGEHPVTPASVTAANLELKLYGASSKEIQLTGVDGDENNPTHVWTGLCTTPCGLALRDKTRYVDLTGLARIRWNVKTSGFHEIRPIVKLADGTWLVGDHTDATALDWLVGELSIASLRWLKLDPERLVTTGNFVDKPDLSKVDEVGFVDLMPASGHGPGGWSDVAQIEIYGKPVPR
jgi:hypothetical protein